MTARFDLEGRKARVTGAGIGIGQAIACELARHGAAVTVGGGSRGCGSGRICT